MDRVGSMFAAVALLLVADAFVGLRASTHTSLADVSPTSRLANPQDTRPAPDKADKDLPAPGDTQTKPDHPQKAQSGPLRDETKLTLVRYVDGELVRVVRSIPGGKKGFHVKAGTPLDERALRIAVASSGSAINPGDRAQITNLEFKDKEIIVDINGGGKGRTHLRDHIHLEVGGAIPTMTTTTSEPAAAAPAGATIYLDFEKSVP